MRSGGAQRARRFFVATWGGGTIATDPPSTHGGQGSESTTGRADAEYNIAGIIGRSKRPTAGREKERGGAGRTGKRKKGPAKTGKTDRDAACLQPANISGSPHLPRLIFSLHQSQNPDRMLDPRLTFGLFWGI